MCFTCLILIQNLIYLNFTQKFYVKHRLRNILKLMMYVQLSIDDIQSLCMKAISLELFYVIFNTSFSLN